MSDKKPDPAASIQAGDIKSLGPEAVTRTKRVIAAEIPVALTFNGICHAVMMTTPRDLEDFARGFAMTEGIVADVDEIADIEHHVHEDGLILKIEIPKKRMAEVLRRGRSLVGQTGCGICGVMELEAVLRAFPKCQKPAGITRAALFSALEDIAQHQPLNSETGAVHGAAFVNAKGKLQLLREDVGRHNALDKLAGAMAQAGLNAKDGFILLTSRCSYELVQKALAMGAAMLVTVSAPTSLAVRLAEDHKLTLIALARSDAMLCFNDPFGLFPEN